MAPTHGEAKNSWLTGAAAWNYVAITQWVLGIRPTFDGLQVKPAIPSNWPGFKATCVHRGVTFRISVERAEASGGYALAVDGEPVESDIVPWPESRRTEVEVRVVLGSGGDGAPHSGVKGLQGDR